jgi:hypothetical protein
MYRGMMEGGARRTGVAPVIYEKGKPATPVIAVLKSGADSSRTHDPTMLQGKMNCV